MKKNILTIIILAATLINLTLTAVMLFVFLPNAKKSNALITKVAQIVDLELEDVVPNEPAVDTAAITPAAIEEELQVNLAKSANDSKSHFAVVKVSLNLYEKSEDYAKMKEQVTSKSDRIKEIVQDVIMTYSFDNVLTSKEEVKAKINEIISKEIFDGSDVFQGITFSKYVAQ